MIEDGARHFQDFDGVTYLNCAAQSPLPNVTVKAMTEAMALKIFPNRFPDELFFTLTQRARQGVAPLMGVEPDHVMLGNGAAHGMNVAALGLDLVPGDEVVVAANDFPSNIYIWCGAAERSGAKAVVIQGRGHAATTEEVLAAINSRTKVVSVSAVDFGSGEVIDLEQLGEACRAKGIFLAVDATQAVGVVPFSIKGSGISLFTVAGYKWMLGPYGGGFAYLDPAWWERVPPRYVAWAAAEGAENFNNLPRENWQWAPNARRYDGPEAASFIHLTGLAQSAEFIAKQGRESIHRHIQELFQQLETGLPRPFRRRAAAGVVPGPIFLIEADDKDRVHAKYQRLRSDKIWVSLREDGIRVSPHMYNTPADIDRLLSILSQG